MKSTVILFLMALIVSTINAAAILPDNHLQKRCHTGGLFKNCLQTTPTKTIPKTLPTSTSSTKTTSTKTIPTTTTSTKTIPTTTKTIPTTTKTTTTKTIPTTTKTTTTKTVPTTTTTTTTTTKRVCPTTGALGVAAIDCKNMGGQFYGQNNFVTCDIDYVCFLPCKQPPVAKTIPTTTTTTTTTTTSTKTIPTSTTTTTTSTKTIPKTIPTSTTTTTSSTKTKTIPKTIPTSTSTTTSSIKTKNIPTSTSTTTSSIKTKTIPPTRLGCNHDYGRYDKRCVLPPITTTKIIPTSSTKTIPQNNETVLLNKRCGGSDPFKHCVLYTTSTKTIPYTTKTTTKTTTTTTTPVSTPTNTEVIINGASYCGCQIKSEYVSDISRCEEEASKYGYVKGGDVTETCIPVTVTVTEKVKETITKKETITVTVTETPTVQCAAKWAQCGGIGFNGPTCCQSGTCQKISDYYSQCI